MHTLKNGLMEIYLNWMFSETAKNEICEFSIMCCKFLDVELTEKHNIRSSYIFKAIKIICILKHINRVVVLITNFVIILLESLKYYLISPTSVQYLGLCDCYQNDVINNLDRKTN